MGEEEEVVFVVGTESVEWVEQRHVIYVASELSFKKKPDFRL